MWSLRTTGLLLPVCSSDASALPPPAPQQSPSTFPGLTGWPSKAAPAYTKGGVEASALARTLKMCITLSSISTHARVPDALCAIALIPTSDPAAESLQRPVTTNSMLALKRSSSVVGFTAAWLYRLVIARSTPYFEPTNTSCLPALTHVSGAANMRFVMQRPALVSHARTYPS